MLAGPPAFRLMSKSAAHFFAPKIFFCAQNKEVPMSFKHKLSVRLALLKDQRPDVRKDYSHDV